MDRVFRCWKTFRPQDETRQLEYTFNVVECAIGWPSGLLLLSEAGYQLDEALKLTIFRGDLNSLQTLLASESYLPNSCLRSTLCLNCHEKAICTNRRDLFTSAQYCSSSKQEVMKYIVNAIKSRRERLLSLALSKLPERAVQSLNLDASRLLDTDAPTIADMLRRDGIELPVCLNPEKTSVFNSFHINCAQGGIQLANILYDTGFTEIDASDDEGVTPLQRLVNHAEIRVWLRSEALAIRWLVEHGADVNKPFGCDRVPLIFDLASTYRGRPWHIHPRYRHRFRWDWSSDSSLRKLLLEGSTALRRCCSLSMDSNLSSSADGSHSGDQRGEWKPSGSDQEHDASDDDTDEESSDSEEAEPCQRRDLLSVVAKHSNTLNDECNCYCSPNGCLPIHKFSVLHKGSVKTWGQIQDDLFSWIEDCDTSGSQAKLYIEAACQLELFERLEMAHTCCGRPPSYKLAEMSRETRRELQAEDTTSKEQLDLIMNAFKNAMKSRGSWPLREFWKWWWKIIDVILPPPLPWERGLRHLCPEPEVPSVLMSRLLDISADRSQRLQDMAGYKNVDFLDVIQRHLAQLLSDDQQETITIRLPESSSYSQGSSVHARKSKARRTETLRRRRIWTVCCCSKGSLCK